MSAASRHSSALPFSGLESEVEFPGVPVYGCSYLYYLRNGLADWFSSKSDFLGSLLVAGVPALVALYGLYRVSGAAFLEVLPQAQIGQLWLVAAVQAAVAAVIFGPLVAAFVLTARRVRSILSREERSSTWWQHFVTLSLLCLTSGLGAGFILRDPMHVTFVFSAASLAGLGLVTEIVSYAFDRAKRLRFVIVLTVANFSLGLLAEVLVVLGVLAVVWLTISNPSSFIPVENVYSRGATGDMIETRGRVINVDDTRLLLVDLDGSAHQISSSAVERREFVR